MYPGGASAPGYRRFTRMFDERPFAPTYSGGEPDKPHYIALDPAFQEFFRTAVCSAGKPYMAGLWRVSRTFCPPFIHAVDKASTRRAGASSRDYVAASVR